MPRATLTTVLLSKTDCWYCESCWINSVEAARTTQDGCMDLLCLSCAEANFPRRVDIFPPFGIFGLSNRKSRISNGKHAKPGGPKLPPDPGPHPPPNPRPQSPPGTPPV
ncbi:MULTISPECIES: hypothetical protein [unclassified Streptomyces]|uniref:hypothetical protein n=1 Tax=unclassified Streptomyces TaxID=2593676 RepID=UPI00101DBA24|nr:hypothetical protein [Streptomyces sp. L-9-10]